MALPAGWKALDTSRAGDLAYRVTFGKDDDPRTLAVTYSERVGPDPVAVWRDDVQPQLEQADIDFRRIGEIRATTYQGRKAADMEWLADDSHGARLRTFGRGFLIGESRSFSLRWTTCGRGLGRRREPAGPGHLPENLPADLRLSRGAPAWIAAVPVAAAGCASAR